MNRRGFLHSVLATVALTTGLARTRLGIVDDEPDESLSGTALHDLNAGDIVALDDSGRYFRVTGHFTNSSPVGVVIESANNPDGPFVQTSGVAQVRGVIRVGGREWQPR